MKNATVSQEIRVDTTNLPIFDEYDVAPNSYPVPVALRVWQLLQCSADVRNGWSI
jgi:hypothetical protein